MVRGGCAGARDVGGGVDVGGDLRARAGLVRVVVRGVAGTQCVLAYDSSHGVPEAGDTVRSDAGSCYLIDRVRPSPSRPGRFYLEVTRLPAGAVAADDPGVWGMTWYRREKGSR